MFGRLFGSGSEKELSSEVSAKLLKPALNSSHDAIIAIKNSETILFSNHIMKKIYLAKNGSPLDDLQDHILFYTPVTKDWSPLENLIEYHDEHNAPEPTLFVGSKMRHERDRWLEHTDPFRGLRAKQRYLSYRDDSHSAA